MKRLYFLTQSNFKLGCFCYGCNCIVCISTTTSRVENSAQGLARWIQCVSMSSSMPWLCSKLRGLYNKIFKAVWGLTYWHR